MAQNLKQKACPIIHISEKKHNNLTYSQTIYYLVQYSTSNQSQNIIVIAVRLHCYVLESQAT